MRMLHTMIRVGDLQRSIDFYTQVLGMKLLRKTDYPSGRFTNAFVGYDEESKTAVLELTRNWDTRSYDLGSGPMKHGTTVIAFVEDPAGYKIEFVERKR